MRVRWITAFVDRSPARFAETEAFWLAVTGSELSPRRGSQDEFATLLPSDRSDAHLRIQRTSTGTCGSHIDLHVDDVRASVDGCVSAGASVVADHGGYVVLASPGGLHFCVVTHHGEQRRQEPVSVGEDLPATLLDQVSVDADPSAFDDEVRFWSEITGWAPMTARLAEFVPLERPPGMPLRILLQRRLAASGPTSCHLDIACDDRDAAVRAHVALGASVLSAHRFWTVMADPAATAYCLTSRLPTTGVLRPDGE